MFLSSSCVDSGQQTYDDTDLKKDETTDADKCTVFVGNIPYHIQVNKLRQFLSAQFGDVRYVKLVKHVITKRFLGAAFVRFYDADCADAARNELITNGVKFHGRLLRGGHSRSKGGGLQTSQPTGPQEGESERLVTVVRLDKTLICITMTNPCVKHAIRHQILTKINNRVNSLSECSAFARLNDDCLTQILSYIDPVERFKIERVSVMWQRCAIRASTHQRHLLVTYQSNGLFGIRESETQLCRLISRNSASLVSLDLSLVPSKVKKSAVETIGSCCRKLERLDISGAFISNVGITRIVDTCNRLKWLKVDGCSRITEKGFWNIFKHCKQLESLLCNANRMSGNCFKIAPSSLKEVDLRHCHIQSENGIRFLSNRCSNLTTLNLNNCKLPSLAGLNEVFKNCPKLQDINIAHMHRDDIPVTQQEDLLQTNPIQSLCNPAWVTTLMIDNARLTDRDLQFLCHNCVNLRELDVSCNFLNDDSVSQLSSLTNLEFLHICHVYNITNSALTGLVTRGKLKCLRMQGCRKITDDLLELMAVSCTQLEELDIAGVVHASAKTLSAFSRNREDQPSRNLKIYAYNNTFLDDENKWPECASNVLVCVVYRRLYASHDRWVIEGSEDPYNIVVNRWWDQYSSEEEGGDVVISPSTSMNNLNLEAENENPPPGMSMEKPCGPRNCSEASGARNSGFDEPSERAEEAARDESKRLEGSSIACVPVDMVDDWDDVDYFADGNYDDEFLVNDDPLEQEYWDRS